MGVAGEEELGRSPGRRVPGGVPVAVGEKDLPPLPVLDGVATGGGKGGAQVPDAVVAVALHPEDLPGQGVEQADHSQGVIAVAGVIGAGVGQIPQQHQLPGPLLAVEVQQLPAVGQGAVEVGCNESFHRRTITSPVQYTGFSGKGQEKPGKGRNFSVPRGRGVV